MRREHLQHLYSRTGFGLSYDNAERLKSTSRRTVVERLFRSSRDFTPLTVDLTGFEEFLNTSPKELKERYSEAELQEFRKRSREKVKALNAAWLNRLSDTDQILREKMTLFWTNVFVCRDTNILHIQEYNNTLRKYALGNFGDFVKAVSKEPSMSKYLNNRQNVAESPNENFARELMELFTLGIGNYTEQDIREAARAFTGWSFRKDGSFWVRRNKHDFGVKTFLGQTGNFDGDDIIDIILEQKQCARFICTKIYSYFVNPVPDSRHIEELTDIFYRDYDIRQLMHHLFVSDWFYDPANRGVKIKSPVELLAGIRTIVPVQFEKERQLLYLQRMMGQVLLYPPNVAGWKGDRNWIDSNTLVFRMKLPALLLNSGMIDLQEKGDYKDPFERYYRAGQNKNKFLKTKVSWDQFEKEYGQLPPGEMKDLLIAPEINPETAVLLSKLRIENNREYCVQLMSLPEYQLC